MNYIWALREFLINDNDINSVVGDRVYFLRTKNKQTPLIIFTEEGKQNPYTGGQMGKKGIDEAIVNIEVIVKYEDSWKGRQLRELIKAKLNGFEGELANDGNQKRFGTIAWLDDLDVGFDENNDLVSWSSRFIFKSIYNFN